MNIYEMIPDSDEFNCLEAKEKDYALLDLFAGSRIGKKWQPVRVKFDTTVGSFGDFPSLRRSIPVFSEKAWSILEPRIGESVEAFPLVCKEGAYFAINVIDVVDCLDLTKSEITKISERITYVDKYVFRSNVIDDKLILKIPQTLRREVFVTDEFKSVVIENHLKGLIFNKMT